MNRKISIMLFLVLFLINSASALSFNNFTGVGGVSGSVNVGNGYFNDDASAFGYTGSRNVYIVGELSGVYLFEPISRVNVPSATYQLVNSSYNTIYDAVVSNGYIYFVDGTTLKKRLTRDSTSACESSDSTSGGCVAIMASGVGKTVRTLNGVVYFTVGNLMKHLDVDGNSITDFAFTSHDLYGGFVVFNNVSTLTTYSTVGSTGVNSYYIDKCTLSGCSVIVTATTGSAYSNIYGTLYPTTNYIYAYNLAGAPASSTHETLLYLVNSTLKTVDYIITDGVLKQNRAYVGGNSNIGLWSTGTAYETYNSIEVGVASVSISSGSGLVSYAEKSINVPGTTYYNNSIIPINVVNRFVISQENYTNFLPTISWFVRVYDPNGVEAGIYDTPNIVCQTNAMWWDILELLFPTNGKSCDGSGTLYYTPDVGEFWLNGTYRVELIENVPGETSILSYDTYNILNNQTLVNGGTSAGGPPGSGLPSSLSNQSSSDIGTSWGNNLSSFMAMPAFWGLILLLIAMYLCAQLDSLQKIMPYIIFIFLNIEAIFGMWQPYTLYVLSIIWIGAGLVSVFGALLRR